MSDALIRDLKMAEVSLAKVPNVTELQAEARKALTDIRTAVEVKEQVEKSLQFIDSKADHEITPQDAEEIDKVINDFGGLKIRPGGILQVTGNESFGLDITPADWRASRRAGLESILDETYRDIKRWANNLQDTFSRRWTELTTSLQILENRIENLEAAMDSADVLRPGSEKVHYNPILVKTLSKPNVKFDNNFPDEIPKELKYFSTIMKLYEMEIARFKATIFKFFGTPKLDDVRLVKLDMLKILTDRVKEQPQADVYQYQQSKPLLGDRVIIGKTLSPKWIKENWKSVDDNEAYVVALAESSFSVSAESKNTESAVTLDTLSLTQMFGLLSTAKELVAYIKEMNNIYNKLDMDKVMVKDVLDTLKKETNDGGMKVALYQYIVSDYQYQVNSFRTEVSAYLTVLTSHILTAVNLNLECYDAR
ncbi:hypothetical protein CF8_0101 [Aeromonas phage CF8]|nr:hypothetical protein CF8_0101 [Aeromonas phage CF8]